MQSANSLALQELNEIRERHKAELEANTAKVRSLAPEYAGIEADMMRAGNSLLRSVLHGGKDFEKIKSFIEAKQREKLEILKRLSLPEDFLDEKYDCENCHDTGFDDNGLKCNCLKELVSKYISINSNMTELMKNQTFENFDLSLFSPVPDSSGKAPLDVAKSARDIAKNFAENFDKVQPSNLLLRGNAGTGKTFISSCIGNLALKRNKTVYYQTSYKLCELMENVKFGKYESPDEQQSGYTTIKYINDVDLLIIDDLGTEFLTQFTAAAIFDLLNTRLLKNKATVISTNLGFEAMEKLYSQRLTSRIFGEYKIVTLVGSDLRRKSLM